MIHTWLDSLESEDIDKCMVCTFKVKNLNFTNTKKKFNCLRPLDGHDTPRGFLIGTVL